MSDRWIPELNAFRSPSRESLDYNQLKNDRTKIGSGGQGVVYRVNVSSPTLPEQVAVKEPASESKTIAIDDMETLLDEANTWEDLDRREREKPRWDDSEHIVGVIDVGNEQLPWIAMEYMDGGGLDNRLEANSNGIPADEGLWFGECICRGVEVAHNYGIAHLDLKPSNVLFRKTTKDVWDVPKIADWGLARQLTEHTETMEKLSVLYAAPEQFDRETFGDPDMLTDVYQVGALVYAMLTGEPPYNGEQASVMHDIVYGNKPTPPSEIRDHIPPAIDEVVLKALAKEKTDRYRNIGEFEKALHAIRTGQSLPRSVSQPVGSTDDSSTNTENSIKNSGITANSAQATGSSDTSDPTTTDRGDSNPKTSQTASTESAKNSNKYQKSKNFVYNVVENLSIEDKSLSVNIVSMIVIFSVTFFTTVHFLIDGSIPTSLAFMIIILPPLAGGAAAGWYGLSVSLPVIVTFTSVSSLVVASIIAGTFSSNLQEMPILLTIALIPSLISFYIVKKSEYC